MDLKAPPHSSYWVIPGVLLAGPYPGAPDAATTRGKLEDFLDAGVRSFVDLTEAGEHGHDGPLLPYAHMLEAVAKERGVAVTYLRIPIRDTYIPSMAGMREIIVAISRGTAERGVVYVHCWGGVGRTGTVVGCLLVDNGMEPEAALLKIVELRRDNAKAWRSAPENELQVSFVRNWRSSVAHDIARRDVSGADGVGGVVV